MSTDSTPHDDRSGRRTPISFTGHVVVDDQHHRIGTVSDVIYDDRGEPRWAVVDPGPLRSEKFVPVGGAYLTEDGDVVVPYAKEQVKQAPKVGRDHVMDARTESVLAEHYEVR